ncbi:uncharacterized protein LOC135497039 [Lineus longissimus]|uniref:uncharacterized protein LOC135497039 n=1 Tax=Lineus longissimus TaxID=88925 RepID=UPI002B4C9C02
MSAKSVSGDERKRTACASSTVEVPAPVSDGDKKAMYLGYTKKPRTPNVQYTVLTDEQIMNIKKDPSPLFMCGKPKSEEEENPNGPPREGGRYYKDRFVNSMSQYYLRGEPLHDPFCYIDSKWSRNIDGQHGNCRIAANPRWGVTKVEIPGSRTLRHIQAEDKNDYLTIDCYRRPPTNQPGQVIFKYGRPSEGYYSERNPSITTWNGASLRLNNQQIVPSTIPKTIEDYSKIDSTIRESLLARSGEWPEWSEYTDKFVMHRETQRGEPLEEHWLTDKTAAKSSTPKDMTAVSC